MIGILDCFDHFDDGASNTTTKRINPMMHAKTITCIEFITLGSPLLRSPALLLLLLDLTLPLEVELSLQESKEEEAEVLRYVAASPFLPLTPPPPLWCAP